MENSVRRAVIHLRVQHVNSKSREKYKAKEKGDFTDKRF